MQITHANFLAILFSQCAPKMTLYDHDLVFLKSFLVKFSISYIKYQWWCWAAQWIHILRVLRSLLIKHTKNLNCSWFFVFCFSVSQSYAI